MLMATTFFLFRIMLFWCRLCLPSASRVVKGPNGHNAPWPTIFHPSCSLTAALWSWWLHSPLYSGGHTQGKEQSCSYRPTVNMDSKSGLKSSLEATLKGRTVIPRRSLKKMQFLYSHILNSPLLYWVLYGIKPKLSIPYWKQTQKSSKLIQVSLETEVFSDSVSSFDLAPVWLFTSVSAVSDICFASKLIFSGNSSAKIKRHTESIQGQYAS